MAKDDDFFDKALEGFAMFALNQGEVCTCPSRALVQRSIYDKFMEKAIARVKKIKQGNPLDADTMIGAQASNDQLEKILSYVDIGKKEGAKLLTGGERLALNGELAEGYYMQPTVFEGNNRMRIFQEEIFGPGAVGHALRRRGGGALRSPTTRSMASAPACGRATSIVPIAWAAASRRDGCGPIATTSTRRMRRSAATRSRASGARTIR